MDYETARDEILQMVTDYWDAQTEAQLGATAPIVYEEVGSPDPRYREVPWMRLIVRHTNGRQATLGGIGFRRFEKTGLVQCQIFAPKSKGVTTTDRLAKIATDSLEGKSSPGGVWFRNVRATELGPEGPWFRTNVVAEFVYDDIK